MKSALIGLLAETSLHPGTESSLGAIDLPVAREVATGYPVIVGSSLKGSLRDMAQNVWGKGKTLDLIFGMQDNAGAVSVSDARILLLPVRSLTGHYKWVTCTYLLERYQRDLQLAGLSAGFDVPRPEKGKVVVSKGQGQIFLEELSFIMVEQDISEVLEGIAGLIKHQSVRHRITGQLAILNDDDFSYFAAYGLQVTARNQLADGTKTSKNLWYEETIPPDSLFYALLITRSGREEAFERINGLFDQKPYLQVGGNETIGQGWCVVSWLNGGVD